MQNKHLNAEIEYQLSIEKRIKSIDRIPEPGECNSSQFEQGAYYLQLQGNSREGYLVQGIYVDGHCRNDTRTIYTTNS